MTAARRLLRGAALVALFCGGTLLGRDLYLRAKGAVAAVLIDRAWAAHLDDGDAHRPWPWADFTPVARIEIGRRGLSPAIAANGNRLAFTYNLNDNDIYAFEPGKPDVAVASSTLKISTPFGLSAVAAAPNSSSSAPK